jgi:hypothetical protein
MTESKRFAVRDDLDVYSSDSDEISEAVGQITDVICDELGLGDDQEFENDLIKDGLYTLVDVVERRVTRSIYARLSALYISIVVVVFSLFPQVLGFGMAISVVLMVITISVYIRMRRSDDVRPTDETDGD